MSGHCYGPPLPYTIYIRLSNRIAILCIADRGNSYFHGERLVRRNSRDELGIQFTPLSQPSRRTGCCAPRSAGRDVERVNCRTIADNYWTCHEYAIIATWASSRHANKPGRISVRWDEGLRRVSQHLARSANTAAMWKLDCESWPRCVICQSRRELDMHSCNAQ